MNNVVVVGDFSLRRKYVPRARYNQLGDYVEYVREEKPFIIRRIDSFLSIAVDIDTRRIQGFRLTAFKNFYINHLAARETLLPNQFLAVVSAIELAATRAGDQIFGPLKDKKFAYTNAYNIAAEDRVVINFRAVA